VTQRKSVILMFLQTSVTNDKSDSARVWIFISMDSQLYTVTLKPFKTQSLPYVPPVSTVKMSFSYTCNNVTHVSQDKHWLDFLMGTSVSYEVTTEFLKWTLGFKELTEHSTVFHIVLINTKCQHNTLCTIPWLHNSICIWCHYHAKLM
jgi:hypothetical protein